MATSRKISTDRIPAQLLIRDMYLASLLGYELYAPVRVLRVIVAGDIVKIGTHQYGDIFLASDSVVEVVTKG